MGLCTIERVDRGRDLGLKLMEDRVHQDHLTLAASGPATGNVDLLQLCEGFLRGFGFFTVGVELQVGLILGDGFIFLLHLLRDLGQGKVSGGVVGLNGNGFFGAEVGALIVFVAHIKLCDAEVLVDALVVGLNLLDLGELAVDGGPFGHITVGVGGEVGRKSGVAAAGA